MSEAAKTELMQAVEKLLVGNTFSPEAVRAVADLTEKATKAESRIKSLETALRNIDSELRNAVSMGASIEEKLSASQKDNEELRKKIEAGREDKYKAQQASAVADAYKDALHTVFRPNAVREHIQRSVPVATDLPVYGGSNMMSGGSSVQNYQTNESIVREEGV